MTEFLRSVTGNPFCGILLAVLTLLACRGIGVELLWRCGIRKRVGTALPVCLGMHLIAFVLLMFSFFSLPVCALSVFLLFLAAGLCLNGRDPHSGPIPYAVLAVTLFLLGNALSPPSGWDECVYQLTIPVRWVRTGTWNVFPDLPYSAFPLLPQFLYRELTALSGVHAAKAFSILILCLSPWALCELFPGKRNAFARIVLPLGVMLAPVFLMLACGSYAEGFLGLDLLCALLLLKREDSPKGFLLTGLLILGPAAAVKLTGFWVAAAVWIGCAFSLFRTECPWKRAGKKLFLLGAGTALYAFFFYLRPYLACGNPFGPYLASYFTDQAGIREMSSFHHAIGRNNFGTEALSGVLTAPVILGVPCNPFRLLFDGSWSSVLWLNLFLFLEFLRQHRKHLRRVLPQTVLLLSLYLSWYFTSPQARFLLPGVLLLCCFSARTLSFANRSCRMLCILFTAAGILTALPQEVYLPNTLIRFLRFRDPVNLLYNESGHDLVPCMDLLRRNASEQRTLLLFEERTLYAPENCVIGTPFFQGNVLTPPEQVTPETLKEFLRKHNFGRILFRIPGTSPDLDRAHLERCAPLFHALNVLEKEGVLQRQSITPNAILYSVRTGF